MKPRIILLCGGESSFPAIHLLALEKYLSGIVIGGKEKEAIHFLRKQTSVVGIPFFQLSSALALHELKTWLEQQKPDAVFSIGFPYRIPLEILILIPGRFFNFHMGPLPKYRGSMPIFEVLRAGEKETAIAVHKMEAEFDTGAIVFQEPLSIEEGETFGSLAVKMRDRLPLVAQNLAQMLEFGVNVPAFEQQQEGAAYHSFPDEEDTRIIWPYMEADKIIALINACNPWNQGADTMFGHTKVKIIAASVSETRQKNTEIPGTVLHICNNEAVKVACINEQCIEIDIIATAEGTLPAWKLKKLGLTKGVTFI